MAMVVRCDNNNCRDEIIEGFFELRDTDFENKPEGRKQFCTLQCVASWAQKQSNYLEGI